MGFQLKVSRLCDLSSALTVDSTEPKRCASCLLGSRTRRSCVGTRLMGYKPRATVDATSPDQPFPYHPHHTPEVSSVAARAAVQHETEGADLEVLGVRTLVV